MKISIKYGFLIILLYSLSHVVVHFTIGHESGVGKSIMLLNYPIYALAILLGVVERRKAQLGHITYKEAFGTGFSMMVFAALIISVYQYIYLKFFNHHLVSVLYNEQSSNDAFENLMKELKKTPGGNTILELAGRILAAALISLIIGAFIKREISSSATNIKE